MKLFVVDDIPVLGELKHLFLSVTDRCYRTEYLLSLYQDDQLPSRLSKEVEDHLSDCASCKAALAIMAASRRVLASRPIVAPPTYLSEKLRQAIALEATKPAPVTTKPPRLYGRLALAGGGLAAAIVFAAILLNHPTPHAPTLSPGHGTVVATKVGTSPTTVTVPITSEHRLRMSTRTKNSGQEMLASLPSPRIITRWNSTQQEHWSESGFRGHTVLGAAPKHGPTTTVVELAKLVPPTHKSSTARTGEMIASVPRHTQAPGEVAMVPQPLSTAPTAVVAQTAPVAVADNIVQETHVNLDNRLRSLALNIRLPLAGQIQPDRNEVQVASYSPGVQITGSGIDH